MHIYIYTYIHRCIYTYIHIYIYTHNRLALWPTSVLDNAKRRCSQSGWWPSSWPPAMFKTSFRGRCRHPRTPQEGEKVPCTLLGSSARPRNRSTAFLQWIMVPWALPPYKYAVNIPVARGIPNMQSIRLAALDGARSLDLEASKKCLKETSHLRSFCCLVLPSVEVATGPCKNAGI